jgi:hypothetical protein
MSKEGWRALDPAYYRPTERRLSSLTNEELRAVYDVRAAKLREALEPKGLWDDVRIVYWGSMIPRMQELYEVLLEIQSRYPKNEICRELDTGFYKELLPVPEPEWMKRALAHRERWPVYYGLKELPKDEGPEQAEEAKEEAVKPQNNRSQGMEVAVEKKPKKGRVS